MKTKYLLPVFILTAFCAFQIKSQVVIDTVALVSTEETTAEFCFNNSKLMAGNSTSDRYLVYYNADTVFLNIFQSGVWTRKIAYTGSNIKSAALTSYKDTIWICWKEKPNLDSYIKALYTPDKGVSWSAVLPVSPAGNVAAPSVYASSNGKIHFVWTTYATSDTTVYHVYRQGNILSSPTPLSNSGAQGLWPSVIAIGDTVLCAWKEGPLPTKVWSSSSFNGGTLWNPPVLTTTSLSISKDPNLAYAYDSTSGIHYVYLAYDGQNKIYFQRSTDFGNSWSSPDTVSNPYKYSQFAHLECNNQGFVGISYEQRTVTSLFDDTKKDVGFVYSTAWGQSGSFENDSLAYTYNPFGSVYPGFNKIDENNFYLAWLTKDTILNKMKIFERHVSFSGTTGVSSYDNNSNNNSITIFPNPTNGIVNINVANQKIYSIKIYNSSGEFLQEDFTTELSISNFPNGLYFVIVQTDKRIFTNRLIKQ